MANASWCRQLGRRLLMYLHMRGIFQLDITECKIVNRFGMPFLVDKYSRPVFFWVQFLRCSQSDDDAKEKEEGKKKTKFGYILRCFIFLILYILDYLIKLIIKTLMIWEKNFFEF
jgi:hypothetical protein